MLWIVCLSMLLVSTAANSIINKYHSPSESTIVLEENKKGPTGILDEKRAAGRWYGIARTMNPFASATICVYDDTCLNEDGTSSTEVTGLNINTGYHDHWGGLLIPKGEKCTGDYTFQFPPESIHKFADYTILETDYEHFIVTLMTLDDADLEKSVTYAWIGSRTPKLASKYYQSALMALENNKVPIGTLEMIKQDCKNYEDNSY